MTLRASGARYAGVRHGPIAVTYLDDLSKRREAQDRYWIEARSADRVFFPAHLTYSGDGLGVHRIGATEWTSYPMFKLAIAAGWYVPPAGRGSFPESIRGVAVAGGKAWMGSSGIGIAALDLRDETWSRYDVKAGVLPGIHTEVFGGDDDYLFARSAGPSGGWKEHLPDVREGDLGPALEVYSFRRNRWIRVTGIPREDVVQFGWTASLRLSIMCDTRPHAKRPMLPMELCTWPHHVEAAPSRGGYLLWAEFDPPSEPLRYVVRRGLLDAAFEETARSGAR